MVLEDASASPTSTSSTFDSPPSDYDTYTASPNSLPTTTTTNAMPQDYTLDLSRFPKPLPLLGWLFGFGHDRRYNASLGAIHTLSAAVQRPLTAQECDAVVYHINHGAQLNSYGEPLGLAGAAWRYNATRAEFRFPFWKPDLAKLNKGKFFGLRGTRAGKAWDLARLAAYGAAGGGLGRLFGGFYASSVVAVGQTRDGRLQEVKRYIEGLGAKEVERRTGIVDRTPSSWSMPRQGRQQVGEQQGGGQQGVGQQQEDYGGVQADGDVEGGMSMQSESLGFDDASPTAQAQGQQGQQGGSAWDKLRRPDGKSQGDRRQTPYQVPTSGSAWSDRRPSSRQVAGLEQEQKEGSTVGESYTFSGSEVEKAEARAQSQKEFDDRLDRERQGRDFSDDSRGGNWK